MASPSGPRPESRVAIEPLPVPWLQHEQFASVKAATSAPDGLVTSKKSAVAKVGQELKRARTYVDQQLTQLEKQLVAISSFLDGSSSAMFPAHILTQSAAAVEADPGSAGGAATAGQGVAAPPDGSKVSPTTANALQSVAFLVEDDLASDLPCTTKGLWQYLDAYSYFKPIAPEDVEEALNLEDESLAFGDETLDVDIEETASPIVSGSGRGVRLSPAKLAASSDDSKHFADASTRGQDDFLKERLLAALLPTPSSSPSAPWKEDSAESMENDHGVNSHKAEQIDAKHLKDHRVWRREQDEATYAASWDPSRVACVLRDAGLLEMSGEAVTRCMKDPMDDPVAQEIRVLQAELGATIRETNAAKRVLRQMLDKTKPWLSQVESSNQGNLTKYNALLRRKKELDRKKRLKEKKRMRRDVLRADIASSLPQ